VDVAGFQKLVKCCRLVSLSFILPLLLCFVRALLFLLPLSLRFDKRLARFC
jgi:hypothetical protein